MTLTWPHYSHHCLNHTSERLMICRSQPANSEIPLASLNCWLRNSYVVMLKWKTLLPWNNLYGVQSLVASDVLLSALDVHHVAVDYRSYHTLTEGRPSIACTLSFWHRDVQVQWQILGGSWGSANPPFRLGDHVILFTNERGTSYNADAKSLLWTLVNSRNDQRECCVIVLPHSALKLLRNRLSIVWNRLNSLCFNFFCCVP